MISTSATNRTKRIAQSRGAVQAAFESKSLRLRPGQIFRGKIVRSGTDGRVLVASGNSSFEARTALSLKEGTAYRFLVKSTAPRIELKVLEEGFSLRSALNAWSAGREMRSRFSALIRNLSETRLPDLAGEPPAEILHRIRKLLPVLIYQGPDRDGALVLPRKLLASGIFWENKILRRLLTSEHKKTLETLRVDDLKGLLLGLKEELQTGSNAHRDLSATLEQVDSLLSIIQNHQDINLSAIKQGWGWYWFIPGTDERDLLHGEVFGKHADEEEAHHIQMNLTLSRLGEICVLGFLKGCEISVDIRTTSERTASFLDKNLFLLEEGLKQKGLKIGRLGCELMEDGISFNPFAEGTDSTSGVDVVI